MGSQTVEMLTDGRVRALRGILRQIADGIAEPDAFAAGALMAEDQLEIISMPGRAFAAADDAHRVAGQVWDKHESEDDLAMAKSLELIALELRALRLELRAKDV